MTEIRALTKSKDGAAKESSLPTGPRDNLKKTESQAGLETKTQTNSTKKPVNAGSLPEWVPPPETSVSLDWADIKTVDLSLYDVPGRKSELIDTVSEALRNDGFFYVVGHGIPDEMVGSTDLIICNLSSLPP